MKLRYKTTKYKRYNNRKTKRANIWLQKRGVKGLKKGEREKGCIDKQRIQFPDKLFLEDHTEKIFSFIDNAQNIDNPCLDFSNTKYIDVGSALYIKSFVDNLKEQNKPCTIACSPKNQKMRQILQHLDIFDYGLKITHKDISCWKIREWHTNSSVNYGRVMMQEILPDVLEGKVPSANFSQIAAGLQELLSNCSEHAYTDKYQFKNFYLIVGEYETCVKMSNRFAFCIIDGGQGFRSSLRKHSLFDQISANFASSPDSNLLKAAAEGKFNANKIQNSGRGTGLPAVMKNIELINGSLYLYSDKGSFTVKNKSERTVRERKNHVIGSIIEVILPINEEKVL